MYVRKNREIASPTGSGVLLDLIRSKEVWNRRELQQELGWSRSTLAKRLEELQAHDLIQERGQQDSTGGRPAEAFSLNAQAGVVLCLDLGVSHSRLGITDLGATVLVEDEADIMINAGPEEVLSWAMQCFDHMLTQLGKTREDVKAIGISVPDPVDPATSVIRNPVMMPAWTGVSLVDELGRRYPGVVCKWERDVNACALAEQRYGWPQNRDLIYLKISSGLSCGFLIDGRVYCGVSGAAGDFGSLMHRTVDGGVSRLNEIASGRAIHRELILRGKRVRTTADIVAYARDGDAKVHELLRKAGGVIGESLLDLATLLNPGLLIVGGSLAAAGEPVLGPIRDYFQAQAPILPGGVPEIVRARLGVRAGVLGNAMIAQDQLFRPDRISLLTSGS